VRVRVENNATPFTCNAAQGQILRIPVAHGEGCYFADQRTLDQLDQERRVVLRYVDNPNGSLNDIAGICNERRNVMGLMPHPERAADVLMGSTDGRAILESVVHSLVSAI
jgi:phosphoribosylformylglycinamidine synthase subunit PurQ / glutaminase